MSNVSQGRVITSGISRIIGAAFLQDPKKTWFKNWPSDIPTHMTYPNVPLFNLLKKSAQNHPENVAISYQDVEMSYANLDLESDKFASALASLGIMKEDRVALFLPNVPCFAIAYYGALKAGACVTTISALSRSREVYHQLVDSEAKVVVTVDSLFTTVREVWPKTPQLIHAIVANSSSPVNSPRPERVIEKATRVHIFDQLLRQSSPQKEVAQINPSEDLAVLQYTGGTTGLPRAVMLTHMNLVSNAIAFGAWIHGVEGRETFLCALPLAHIYGMTTSLNVPISMAAKMALMSRFDPAIAVGLIQEKKVTVFCGVPTMYQALLDSPHVKDYDLTSVRACISGASSLPPAIQTQFMELTGGLLAEGYGLTEASPVTHCSPVDRTMKTVRVGSIGLPLPDTDAKIVDAETSTETLSAGEVGELAVRGPQIMKGYWKDPDQTAIVIRDGWLLTGDLAKMDSEGYFYITDRKKDMIKYKDYSVFPREIEDVLYEHPAVKLCAVVGKPQAKVGEIPKAFIVLKEGESTSAEEVTGFVNSRLASYKAIREVEFRKELPISVAGKVLRKTLRDEERSRSRQQ